MQAENQIHALQEEYEQVAQEKTDLLETRTQLEDRVAGLLQQLDARTAAVEGLRCELQRALDDAAALRHVVTAAQSLTRSTAQRCRHPGRHQNPLHEAR